MHLIGFRNAKDDERAIRALLNIPQEYLVVPGPQFVVTDEHIKALEQAKVRFEYLSRTRRNGKKTTLIQS